MKKYGTTTLSNCNKSSRTFKSRVAEHLDDPNSAFGAHLMSIGHNYAESSKLLHSESNYSRRLALEHIEIIKHKQNPNLQILNDFIPDCSLIEKIYANNPGDSERN